MTQHVSIRRATRRGRGRSKGPARAPRRVTVAPAGERRSWSDLVKLGAELGIYRRGMNRAELEYALEGQPAANTVH